MVHILHCVLSILPGETHQSCLANDLPPAWSGLNGSPSWKFGLGLPKINFEQPYWKNWPSYAVFFIPICAGTCIDDDDLTRRYAKGRSVDTDYPRAGCSVCVVAIGSMRAGRSACWCISARAVIPFLACGRDLGNPRLVGGSAIDKS